MTQQTYDSTINTTGQTIESVLPNFEAEVRELFAGLRKLDPDLAARAARIRVLTDEEYRERGSESFDADSSERVWFNGTPSHTTFRRALASVLFGVGHSFSQYLGDLLGQAVMEQDDDLLRLVSKFAVASRDWSIQDVEGRLGMSLNAAYHKAGVVPLWATGPCLDEVVDGEKFASMEPTEFLANCIEGLLHDDSSWLEYTRRLFRVAEERTDQ